MGEGVPVEFGALMPQPLQNSLIKNSPTPLSNEMNPELNTGNAGGFLDL